MAARIGRGTRRLEPVSVSLEGVGGEVDVVGGVVVGGGGEGDGESVGPGVGEGGEELVVVAVVLGEGGQDQGCGAVFATGGFGAGFGAGAGLGGGVVGEGGVDGGGQDGVGAGFDVVVVAVVVQGV